MDTDSLKQKQVGMKQKIQQAPDFNQAFTYLCIADANLPRKAYAKCKRAFDKQWKKVL